MLYFWEILKEPMRRELDLAVILELRTKRRGKAHQLEREGKGTARAKPYRDGGRVRTRNKDWTH